MNAEKTSQASDSSEGLRHCCEEVVQLREALGSRAVIDQATGILMGRYSLSADRAFALLTRVSQDRNHKIRVLAQALVTDASATTDGAGALIDVGVFDVGRTEDSRGSGE